MSSPPLSSDPQSSRPRSTQSPRGSFSTSSRMLPILGDRTRRPSSLSRPSPQSPSEHDPVKPLTEAPASPTSAAIEEQETDDDDQQETAEIPLTLAASMILTNLPGDAKQALKTAHQLNRPPPPSSSSLTTNPIGGPSSSSSMISTITTNNPPIQPLIPPKVTIRVHALGSSPHLKQQLFMLSSSSPFSTVLRLLRRKLGLKPHEGLHCYIGQSFSPAADEEVSGLWMCFKSAGVKTPFELVVQYAVAPTFG